jgi:hypothetical protein
MTFQLESFADLPGGGSLSEALLETLIATHESTTLPGLNTLWNYYRNPLTAPASTADRTGTSCGRRYRLAQERGLPARLANPPHARDANLDDRAASRREVVIENDIAWRVHTMVDFMFGRSVTIISTAKDASLRRRIERALDAIWEASGGISLLHDMGLLGHVYGHVDLFVRRLDAGEADPALELPARLARVEIIEPTRGIPLLCPGDYRQLDAYIIRSHHEGNDVERPAGAGAFQRLLGLGRDAPPRRNVVTLTEIVSGAARQVYEDEGRGPRLVLSGPNLVSPGRVPVVHIQNVSQPFSYAGIGEVEPLIPLQDELNTRLSDRASRVTMQSFRMFLAKGIDGFDKVPVGPGQVWSTDNPDAKVESFGGDAHAQGEDEHIEQVREGLDKASGVPPLASGVVRAKIGNLTSENALRVTLMGLLSKTARKRIGYGRGIAETCRLLLTALDFAGVLKTDPADRTVRVEWPDPLPRDEAEALAAAQAKVELGVPRERILSELGYAPTDPGVV